MAEMEDMSASVDVQDVYTKVKCKVGSFHIDHYRSSAEESPSGGVVLSCTEKLNRRTVLLRPLSKQEPYSHFIFFPPTAGEGSGGLAPAARLPVSDLHAGRDAECAAQADGASGACAGVSEAV
ncbi:vacuolar protein sorting-associated protein 13B-like [Cyprinus carpio]|uniref:Vacuolar protein sorting-associated protein 13B-like n=1 Tax=Cyprinus carpio TaxID=7962 RepID=A0A9Q9Y0P0_CYPCA|nr:vacuolar protein sorting-associated protein 13B-like [Cyprinus carpio]